MRALRPGALLAAGTLAGGLYAACLAIKEPVRGQLDMGQVLIWMARETVGGCVLGAAWGASLALLIRWARDGTIARVASSGLRLARRIPLPTFPWAYAGSAAIAAGFAAWIVVDSMFPMTLRIMARYDAGPAEPGLLSFLTLAFGGNHFWSRILGPRIAACFWLAALGLGASALTLFRFLAGPHRRALRGWMLLIALIAVWLGLWTSYDELVWRGLRWRVGRELPRFEASAPPLLEHWPTSHGRLPEAGEYLVFATRPDLLLLRGSLDQPLRETFGDSISRTKSGGLRYDLSSSVGTLEYHPPGSSPATHVNPHGQVNTLLRSERLKPSWFLTRYR